MKKFVVSCLLLCLLACDTESGMDATVSGGDVPAGVTLWVNGRIYTSEETKPVAEALAFSQAGEIVDVGASDELRVNWPEAEIRDLAGAAVVPGLIDAHGHLNNLALSLTRAQLRGTQDINDVIRVLKEHEQNLADGDWLLGRGWDQNDWPDPQFPDRHDLDRHFPDRPVVLDRVDGHAIWVNSAALAEVDRDLSGSWQPKGGFIHRDASGQPSGILVDGAESLVNDLVPPETEELMSHALDLALQQMVSLGLTGTHDPGVPQAVIERYLRKIDEGLFPSRVYVMAGGAGETLDWLCLQGGIDHESGRLVARSVKLYADGALGSRGAALLSEYSDDPGNRGLLFLDDEALQAQLAAVMSCGFQVAVHAIGDAANRQVLDAIVAVAGQHPGNPGRHRIEHAQVLSEEDIGRFGRHGIIAAVQPTHATSDMYWAEQRLGPERIHGAYAWRSLQDSGARLALGSDFVVEEVNPMLGFYAAITRRDVKGWPDDGWHPEQSLGREEALRGFTLDAAYAGFMEGRVGSLAPGKRADMVILDRDIMQVDASLIPGTVVLETWLDGQRVYLRPAR